MATYTQKSKHLGYEHAWYVPAPAPSAEVDKAWRAAAHGFEQCNGREIEYDNDLMVRPEDNQIVIYFVSDSPRPLAASEHGVISSSESTNG